MKKLVTFACLLVFIRASAQIYTMPSNPYTITSNPLWTDTGLHLDLNQTVAITATGTWSTSINSPNGSSGPDGLALTSQNNLEGWSDGFLAGANKGVLLAYVGTDPYQGHWGDSTFFPAATGYWAIGSNGELTAPEAGELWLGMNDDAVSELVSDNSGSLTATIELVPEPANSVFLCMGLCTVALASRRIFNRSMRAG